jgi:hypothetical protein
MPPVKSKSSYQLICEYVRKCGTVVSLNRAVLDDEIPVSYVMAKKVVRLACKRGDLRAHRDPNSQGRPLVLEAGDD